MQYKINYHFMLANEETIVTISLSLSKGASICVLLNGNLKTQTYQELFLCSWVQQEEQNK